MADIRVLPYAGSLAFGSAATREVRIVGIKRAGFSDPACAIETVLDYPNRLEKRR